MTINTLLKNHNLTHENAIIYNSMIEDSEFENCFKMRFLSKADALEAIAEKLSEGVLVLLICNTESISMSDYADMIENVKTENSIKFCMYSDDSMTEFIVYILY
ncbi:MAG: hypothetical protein EAZ53_15590 [Bacteroidetes bacterium]|nr:MAG: hypothetical protein EAZ53_15590 [Bacteroidota bacterium]